MKYFILFTSLLWAFGYASCNSSSQPIPSHSSGSQMISKEGLTVQSRFNPPVGYTRQSLHKNSFASYLRNVPLKAADAVVQYYNGETKSSDGIYAAVFDLDIGKRNLHQCADAIMRLRAEYLWNQKRYDQIHFNFTNGFRVDYTKWMEGNRVRVTGNKASWKPSKQASNTYSDFWSYMELIFAYAGTASLEKELNPTPIRKMKIGDVFIQGGHPGHAVIVVDMAKDAKGNEVYLLAQSYMPAQELQVLINPMDSKMSPWYTLNSKTIRTPEWKFEPTDLRRFEN